MSESEPLRIKDLPPAPKTMTEQEKREQDERVTRAMFKILARMPIQEVIKTNRNQKENRGH